MAATVARMAVAFNPPDRGRRSLVRGRLHDDNNDNHCYCYYHCYNDNDNNVDDLTTAVQQQDVGIDLDGGGTRLMMMREPMM